MPEPGAECGELVGGPLDGGHVHTTADQARYGVLAPNGHAYYLRGRTELGALRWLHASVLESLGRRWRDRGGSGG